MASPIGLVLRIGLVLFAFAGAASSPSPSPATSPASSPASGPITSGAVCHADEMDLCSDRLYFELDTMCSSDEMDLCSDLVSADNLKDTPQQCAADEMDLCSDGIGTYSQLQWESTVHMFEAQPMISQKITKDFLLSITVTGLHLVNNNTNGSSANGSAAAAHRLLEGAEAAATSNMTDIELFDDHIRKLEFGDPANNIISAANMGTLVQISLQALKLQWAPFKALMLKDTGKAVPAPEVLQIAMASEALLTACQDVMDKVVIMENAAGAHAEEVVVTIARRQTMLMQEMLVEVVLISLGIDVLHAIHVLHEIEITINGANKGIILGAPWAGVPILAKFCTLNEMTKVTTKWAVVKPFIDEIIGANDPQQVAVKNTQQAVAAGDDLEHEMEVAVGLYMFDDGSCNVADQISTSDWKYLLNSVDLQRYYGQSLALQVLNVANNVSIQKSKVDLTINMARTFSSLRTLIEGNEKHSSPPSQNIADLLIASLKVWNEISTEFQVVIFAEVVEPILVTKVIRLAAELLHDMDKVMAGYMGVVTAIKTRQEVPAYLLATAGHQRTYLQEMALEACEIKFYTDNNMEEERVNTLDILNATNDHFLESHWALLKGDPANNLTEVTDLCIIKKMKEVKDQFELLKTAAWKVVAGDKQQIEEMRSILPIAHGFMDIATDYYANGVESCPEVEPTLEEWQAGILAAGVARSSSQKTCTQYLWDKEGIPGPNPGDVKATFWGADGTIGEGMVLAITKLRFGWGAESIPAPYNDKMREDIAHVTSVVTNFSWDLKHDSAEDVVFDSNEMLKESQILVADYLEQAQAAFPSMPANRIEMSTRMDYLVNRMLKEACLIREHGPPRRLSGNQPVSQPSGQPTTSLNHNYTIVISQGDLTRTMNEYSAVVTMLTEGAPNLGVPKVIMQRADIENQQARVAAAYGVFTQDVLCVANADCKATLTMKQSLDDLEVEIHAATSLYYLNDPIVEESYPWTVVIYVVVAVLVVAVIGFGCYRGLREAKVM